MNKDSSESGTKVVVGSIDAELREYSGINGQIKAKVE